MRNCFMVYVVCAVVGSSGCITLHTGGSWTFQRRFQTSRMSIGKVLFEYGKKFKRLTIEL